MSGHWLYRTVFIIGMVISLGDSRCKSSQLKEEIKNQEKKNEEAIKIAKKYIPLGPYLDRVVGALGSSSNLLTKVGNQAEMEREGREKEKARADKNQKAANTIFWAKIIAYALGVAAIFYCLKSLGSKIPIIGRFFGPSI